MVYVNSEACDASLATRNIRDRGDATSRSREVLQATGIICKICFGQTGRTGYSDDCVVAVRG